MKTSRLKRKNGFEPFKIDSSDFTKEAIMHYDVLNRNKDIHLLSYNFLCAVVDEYLKYMDNDAFYIYSSDRRIGMEIKEKI